MRSVDSVPPVTHRVGPPCIGTTTNRRSGKPMRAAGVSRVRWSRFSTLTNAIVPTLTWLRETCEERNVAMSAQGRAALGVVDVRMDGAVDAQAQLIRELRERVRGRRRFRGHPSGGLRAQAIGGPVGSNRERTAGHASDQAAIRSRRPAKPWSRTSDSQSPSRWFLIDASTSSTRWNIGIDRWGLRLRKAALELQQAPGVARHHGLGSRREHMPDLPRAEVLRSLGLHQVVDTSGAAAQSTFGNLKKPQALE